ncbi:mRNA transport regulator MTR2 [Kluyveromyces marxianus]|uniref:mRNA transport regulator MTR2 n=2 Tax=Kluyveromyces marxianus TaxID=4911 RepID=W0TEL8_KLUMD|nr:mRNA transport regulator MTR2 [Kluyveromyces marxianus DMKU3-1042]QGN16284.1 mRNA transport regulator MTR2 [Kluyveromyces marxianus]BAO40554.1 mRNA transport regulator MTR2 [Kluyveromyces marxianus DMKU3-1042]BAP72035.1 mRNA transport regulator MTR2 [Kluyveromyces marxianus]
MNHQSQIVETFVKKVLAHLDEPDPAKLQQFLQLFNPQQCKIIFNSQPFGQAVQFLQAWQTQVVLTQHLVTAVDFHVIPGTGTLVCNVNCKVRFDESGKDKSGQDSTIPDAQGSTARPGSGSVNSATRARPIWGTYYGVSLQLVLEDRMFNNDMNGVISSMNYTIVFKPSDSLMNI